MMASPAKTVFLPPPTLKKSQAPIFIPEANICMPPPPIQYDFPLPIPPAGICEVLTSLFDFSCGSPTKLPPPPTMPKQTKPPPTSTQDASSAVVYEDPIADRLALPFKVNLKPLQVNVKQGTGVGYNSRKVETVYVGEGAEYDVFSPPDFMPPPPTSLITAAREDVALAAGDTSNRQASLFTQGLINQNNGLWATSGARSAATVSSLNGFIAPPSPLAQLPPGFTQAKIDSMIPPPPPPLPPTLAKLPVGRSISERETDGGKSGNEPASVSRQSSALQLNSNAGQFSFLHFRPFSFYEMASGK